MTIPTPPEHIKRIIDENVPEEMRDYAYRMAYKESGYRPNARPRDKDGNLLSSATGLYQFIKGTGKQYGLIDEEGDYRDDPVRNTRAFVQLTMDNRGHLRRALGRDPTWGELAVAHQQGAGGAAALLRGEGQVVGTQAGAPKNARDIMRYYGYDGGNDIVSTSSNVSLYDATPGEVTSNREERINSVMADEAPKWSMPTALWESVKQENMVGWILEDFKAKADPNFNGPDYMETEAEKERLKKYPAIMVKDLVWSVSKDDYERKIELIEQEMKYQTELQKLGWKGTAAQMLGAMADPAGWALAVLSPVSGGAVKLGRAAQILAIGAEGAAGNVIADLPQLANRPGFQKEQLLYSAAGGFAFGTGLGAFIKPRADLVDDVDAMRRTAERLQRNIEARAGAGGAAPNFGDVAPVHAATDLFLTPEFDKAAAATDKSRYRVDFVGRTASPDSDPLSRSIVRNLAEDGVGSADGSATPRAASVEANRINLTNLVWFSREFTTAWDDYATRNKVGWFNKGEAQIQFKADISEATRTTDPARFTEFDPAVQKMATFQKEWYWRWLEMAQNPGVLDGTTRRPLKGFEEVGPNDFYAPRLYDKVKFDGHVYRFGDIQIEKLVKESIYDHLDDISKDLADKVAKAFYKGLREASIGGEVRMSAALAGHDREALRAMLRDAGSISDDEITSVINKLSPPKEGTTNARGKRRTPMNIDHVVYLKDSKTGETIPVKVSDWTENDAVKVAHMYSRTMSADIALARMRIENPAWRQGDPEADRWLVDGIHSESEWVTLMDKVRDVANQKGVDLNKTNSNIERMSFIYDAMKGKVDKWEKGKLGSFLRMVRDWNFTRAMNQVGFAQIPELGVAIGQVGLKTAYNAMPSFRTFLRDARTGKLADELAEEMEWIANGGTDALRSGTFINNDPLGNLIEGDGMMGTLEKKMAKAAHVTSHISGMQAANVFLQRFSMKLIAAKFATAANGDTALNMKRMAVLGIDKDDAKEIFAQIKKHASYFDADGKKLRRLNVENWDPGPRYAFEHAVFSWTRRMIQENDIGQMNSLFGSTWGKIIFQFRSFMIGAYTKNTLHNLSVGTPYEIAMMTALQMTMGTLAYTSQVHLQSLGRSDREKFLEEKLGKEGEYNKLVMAAIQRTGSFSILPAFGDILTGVLGMDPLFNSRVTGTPAQGFVSNPTLAGIDNFLRGVRGVSSTITKDSPLTQGEFRALTSVLPFANALPTVWTLNAAANALGLPEKEPRK